MKRPVRSDRPRTASGVYGSAYGDVGQPYLFQTIAAVVIGGTTLVGGRGGLIGTAAGALVLTEITPF